MDEFYTLGYKSIKNAYDRIPDLTLNFSLLTEEQLIDTIKQMVSELPYDGTVSERDGFIESIVKELISNDERLTTD